MYIANRVRTRTWCKKVQLERGGGNAGFQNGEQPKMICFTMCGFFFCVVSDDGISKLCCNLGGAFGGQPRVHITDWD